MTRSEPLRCYTYTFKREPLRCDSCGASPNPDTGRVRHVATVPVPDTDTIARWVMDEEDTESTDGCAVEPDGICEHGHTSWLRRLGYI